MSEIAKIDTEEALAEAVFLRGDFSNFNAEQKARYIIAVCKSLGLNPLTRPIQFIKLNGQDIPYAKRDAADQLRKINGISLAIVSREEANGLYTVHVRATDKHGRDDEDYGVVALPETLKGEARANAILKAVTKAKRRVTLSISGLGWMDETEVEDTQKTILRPARPAANPMLPPHDKDTGEVTDFADAMDHVLGNGETHDINTEKVSAFIVEEVLKKVITVEEATAYFNTMTPEEKEKYKPLFTARRAEIEEGDGIPDDLRRAAK